MELIKEIVGWLAYASLGFSISAAYLRINKIWIRKHHAEVADSISIVGNVVTIIPLFFFGLNYMFVRQWQGLIDSTIWIVFCIVSIMIGSRLWVQDGRKRTVSARIKDALRLERQEVGDLARELFRPASAESILNILTHFAQVDQRLVEREKAFIQSFADKWHLDIDWRRFGDLNDIEQPRSLIKTREAVVNYLKSSPPTDQVAQLIDVLHALAGVDETVSAQEKLILEEVEGLMRSYMSDTAERASYRVVIAPQSRAQDAAIGSLLPNVEKTEVAGGAGYVVGAYFSQDYANVVCSQYRALGFFTIDLPGGQRG